MDYLLLSKDQNQTNNVEEPSFYIPAIEIVFQVYCLFGIVFNILLIYIFLHFKRLFSVANMFLVHWRIADAIRFFVSPSVYFVLDKTNIHVSEKFICFIMNMEGCFDLLVGIFQALIIIDWCVENFWPSKLVNWRENYKTSIVGVWAPSTFSAILTARICTQDGYYGLMSEIIILYDLAFPLFLLTLVIVRFICKCRQRDLKNNNNLFYFIFVIQLISVIVNWFIFPDAVFIAVTEFFNNSTAYLLLVFLMIENPQFRTCLKQTFTCQLSEDDSYNRETLTGIYCKRCQETLL